MKHRFHIMKRAHYRVLGGIILLLASRILFYQNAQFSEEFTGGVNIGISTKVDTIELKNSIQEYLVSINYKNAKVFVELGDLETKIKINGRVESDEKVAELSKNIQKLLVDRQYISDKSQITSQSLVGPSVGDYMQTAAKNAVIIGLILMAIYMLISFAAIRKSISPAILATITILTMIFDVSIPAGAYGIWMMIDPTVQINTVFIIAILTTMGYSINDTIIIFDRIRENMQIKGGTKDIVYGKIFEDSLRQTMRRSFGTVISTFLVILAMYILGTGDIKSFAFTIGIGVIAGSYSSIFISAPLAYLMMGRYKKEKSKL
ncbi:MAG: protein translocase subunit SecF [Candidatus Absconditicoccaceae bacterium]